jgi:type II secretory pathway pseudopilin PulG
MNRRRTTRDQEGYMLLSVMLLITIMLIVLAAEAPRIAQQIKRSKEEELVHREMQYAIAIKKFFHKTGNYPTSLEQLEDTNHIRFLRKKYTDPMTGEANWKVIHMGEAEIPIPQNKNPGLPGSNNPGLQGSTTSGGLGGGTSAQPNPPPQSTGFPPPPQQQPTNPNGGGPLGTLNTSNIGNAPPGGQQFGGGAIIGVASVSKGTGIKEFNGKSDYADWLFVYDPRLEQATAAAAGAVGGSVTAGIAVASPRVGGTGSNRTGSTPSGTPTPTPVPALAH